MKATSRCALLLIGLFFCVFIYSGIAASSGTAAPDGVISQVQPALQDPGTDPVPAVKSQALAEEIVIIGIPASVASVYDGDTFKANLNIAGCPEVLCDNMPVRIKGIDTPEIKGKCDQEKMAAQQARDHLFSMIAGKVVDIRDTERDKFFRIGAAVYVDGKNVGQDMLNSGHARVYHANSKRLSWCGDSDNKMT